MKKTIFIILLLINAVTIFPQIKKLNQVELVKQFIGRWITEGGEGIFYVHENKPFGNGIDCTIQVYADSLVIDSAKQLIGYNRIKGNFVMAQLTQSSAVNEITSFKFTSEKSGFYETTTPTGSKFKTEFEFVTPDTYVLKSFRHGKFNVELTFSRITG